MYDEQALKKLAELTNQTLEYTLEIYDRDILFIYADNDDSVGKVIKDHEYSSIEVGDIIFTKGGRKLNDTPFGRISIFDCKYYQPTPPKKEKTQKEANGHNIAKAVKLIGEWFEIDPNYAMEKIKFTNEKIKMRNKLIELGFVTKEQRKDVHNAIRNCNRRIKELGVQGAAEDTAEKYKIDAETIKHIRGFQNSLFRDPFK